MNEDVMEIVIFLRQLNKYMSDVFFSRMRFSGMFYFRIHLFVDAVFSGGVYSEMRFYLVRYFQILFSGGGFSYNLPTSK